MSRKWKWKGYFIKVEEINYDQDHCYQTWYDHDAKCRNLFREFYP